MAEKIYQTGQGRVFLQRYGSGPGNPVAYQGCARMSGFTEPLGDITPVYCPDPRAYDEFEVVDEVRGEAGLPTTSMIAKLGRENALLKIRCPFDLQAHYGKCRNPTDFDEGWEKVFIFEGARLTSRSADELTAFAPDGRAEILITGEVTARRIVEVDQMVVAEKAKGEVSREAVDVALCDTPECGECGPVSDGCQVAYVVTISSGLASPGLPSELIYTVDGGTNWNETDIDTLASDENPSAVTCVGGLVIVVSNDSVSLHYADEDDLDAWMEVTAGFVTSGAPNDIWSASPRHTWIVGDSGYVYFTDDPTAGVEVQDAGDATRDDLLRVHGLSELFVVAVGNNNTVIFTENGGLTWVPIAGPEGGVNLTALWVRTEFNWMVGADDGNLYYTVDKGASWVQKPFANDGTGVVRDISFQHNNSAVGFMSHSYTHIALGDIGRVFRTLNGGYSWHLLPEVAGATFPPNDRINRLAACGYNPNFFIGVGLADDALDGIIVVGA